MSEDVIFLPDMRPTRGDLVGQVLEREAEIERLRRVIGTSLDLLADKESSDASVRSALRTVLRAALQLAPYGPMRATP